VLAEDEVAALVEGQPVGARLGPGELLLAGVPARLQERLHAVLRRPPHDAVVRDVGEQQGVVLLVPDRPLGPLEPAGEHLDLGVLRDEHVELRVFPLDAPDGHG
jgi:hypothetical protein